jgi:hypothetical protein
VFARVAMYEQIDVEGWEPVAKWFRGIYEVVQADGRLSASS